MAATNDARLRAAFLGRIAPDLVVFILFLTVFSGTVSTLGFEERGIILARYYDEILLLVIGFISFITILLERKLSLSIDIVWALALIVYGIILSLLRGIPVHISILGTLLIIKPLIILIIFQMIALPSLGFRRLLRELDWLFFLLPLVGLAGAFLFDYLLGPNPFPGADLQRIGLPSARSIFIHPGVLSLIMTLCSIYHAAAYFGSGQKSRLVMICLCIIGVILPLRMKGIFLLPFSIVVIYFLQNLRNRRISRQALVRGIPITLAALAFVTIFALLFSETISFRIRGGVGADQTSGLGSGGDDQAEGLSSEGDDQSDRIGPVKAEQAYRSGSVRMALLKVAAELNANTGGIGVGPGQFGSAVSVFDHFSDLYDEYGISSFKRANQENPSFITDQWWAWYLAEIGLVGTLLFVAAVGTLFYRIFHIGHRWSDTYPQLSALAFAACGFIIYGLAAGYAAVSLQSAPSAFYILGISGLVLAADRKLKVIPTQTEDILAFADQSE